MPMLVERLGVRLGAELVKQLRRAFHIRGEERDGAVGSSVIGLAGARTRRRVQPKAAPFRRPLSNAG